MLATSATWTVINWLGSRSSKVDRYGQMSELELGALWSALRVEDVGRVAGVVGLR